MSRDPGRECAASNRPGAGPSPMCCSRQDDSPNARPPRDCWPPRRIFCSNCNPWSPVVRAATMHRESNRHVARSGLAPVSDVLRHWAPSPKWRDTNGIPSEAVRGFERHVTASHAQTEPGRNSRQQIARAQNEKGGRSRQRGARSIGIARRRLRRANPTFARAVSQTVGAAPGACPAENGSIEGSDPRKTIRSESRAGGRLLPGISDGFLSQGCSG